MSDSAPAVPTQVKQPWRATLRTSLAVLTALAGMAPLVYHEATNQDPAAATGASAGVLLVAAGVTRVLALPAVEVFLQAYVPWMAADGKKS